jgi:predicted phosphohydrolase
MRVWAISDLHLGPGYGKGHPSSTWVDHQQMLRKGLDEVVAEDDVILIPGDLSWNQDPIDLRYDYLWLNERPGFKILSPGNHDYTIWTSALEARSFCQEFGSLHPTCNEALRFPHPDGGQEAGLIIVALEGSHAPEDSYFNTNAGVSSLGREVESVRFLRQLLQLKRCLNKASRIRKEGDKLVVMIHYPPFAGVAGQKDCVYQTAWSKMIEGSEVDLCIYGHLHQKDQFQTAFQGSRGGVEYRFVGADFLWFHPTLIGEWTKDGLTINPPEITAEEYWPVKKTATKPAQANGQKNQNPSGPQLGSLDTDHSASNKPASLAHQPQNRLLGSGMGLCEYCGQEIYKNEQHFQYEAWAWHARCGGEL